jgi:hypothetical protein
MYNFLFKEKSFIYPDLSNQIDILNYALKGVNQRLNTINTLLENEYSVNQYYEPVIRIKQDRPDYSLVNLLDSYCNTQNQKAPIFSVDRALEHDILVDFKSLSKIPNHLNSDFYNAVQKINDNKVYNTKTLFNDLSKIDDSGKVTELYKFARKLLGHSEETNIDSFFDLLTRCTPELIYLDDFNSYIELQYIIDQRDQIKYHLKLKALSRYIKAEIRNLKEHEHTRISLGLPLILHLREYLNNIFNIKRIYLKSLSSRIVDKIIFNIKTHGITIQNRFIMLPDRS